MAFVSDDFNRANSATVGGGWTESEGGGETCSIESNQLKMTSSNSTFATSTYQANSPNTGIVVLFSVTMPSNFANGSQCDIRPLSSGAGANGYGVKLVNDGGTEKIKIYDGGTQRAEANFTLSDSTKYHVKFIIEETTNHMHVYAWADGGSEPGTPTVSWTNGGSNYTVGATGGALSIYVNHNSTVNSYFFDDVSVAANSTTYEETYTETINHTDTVIKSTVRNLLDTITHTDATSTFMRIVEQILTETIALTDSIVRSITRNLTDTITHTDSLIRSMVRNLTDTLTHTDVFAGVRIINQILTETIAFTANILVNGILMASNVWTFLAKNTAKTWTFVSRSTSQVWTHKNKS